VRPRGGAAGKVLQRAAGRPHPGAFEDDAIALAAGVDDARLAQHFQLLGRRGHGLSSRPQATLQQSGQVVAGVGGGLRRIGNGAGDA
jgi:hypothetical protein